MAFVLRSYQQDIINEARRVMSTGERSILITAPTGSGKTVLMSAMFKLCVEKGKRALFLVHRRELVKQSVSTLEKAGLDCGVISSGFLEEYHKQVQVASIQTFKNRIDKIKRPDLIVYDEVHHVASRTWANIFKEFSDCFQVGLTATPERLDGKGLKDYFNYLIEGPKVSWLIENGSLSQYKVFAPVRPDLSKVKRRLGDYDRSSLADVMSSPNIIGNVVEEYKKHAMGKRAVIFCVNIKHSKAVVDAFNKDGLPAAHVDGKSKSLDRDGTIRDLAAGRTLILSNVGLFGEGFDLPSVECCILLRPTQSLGLYLQMVGRALRPHPDKEFAIILDHTGNIQRHGLPCSDREWSLDGVPWKKRLIDQANIQTKTCKVCFGVFKPAPKCPYCGELIPINPADVSSEEGTLVEISKEEIKAQKKIEHRKKMSEQGKARTQEELYKLGKERGYKNPRGWAKRIFNARQRRKVHGK